MAAPKGYASQTALERGHAEFATVEPVREQQQGLSVNAHVYVYIVTSDAAEANSTDHVINATANVARVGDIIHFTSGAFANTEVKVESVTANTITLVQNMASAIATGVTFEILRPKYPVVGSDGSISVTTSQGPVQFVRDGVDTEVNEDTVTPANNRGLPVTIVGAAGEVQITAGSLEVHLDSANDSVAAVQSGTWNITNVSGTVSLPTGAATSAAQATGNASLSSIDGKLNSLGQKLMAASVPVVIASDQSPIAVSGTVSTAEQAVVADGGVLPAVVKVVAGYDGSNVRVLATDANGNAQVDVLTQPALSSGTDSVSAVQSGTWNVGLNAGTNNIGDVDVLTLPSLPAGTNNIGDVDVLSLPAVNLNYLTVVDFLDTPLLIASGSNIPASASTPLTVVASLAAAAKKIQILDTTGEFIGIYADPAGTPVLLAISGPGSDQTIEVAIPAATVIGVRNMKNAVISVGELAINFIG